MKKNILGKLVIWLLAVSMLVGCSDFLNETSANEPTEETYWRELSEAESALATIYSPVRGQMYGYWGAFTGFQNQNVRGDDVFPVKDDEQMWFTTTFTNNSQNAHLADDWDLLYRSIARSNIFLANIDRVETKTAEEQAVKDQMTGEAYFLRAWNYFMLVINWGDVPLRLTPIITTDEAMSPSSPEEEVWKQIEADLKEAKAKLPVTRPASEYGRVTRGAAIAYLGRAYVYQEKFAAAKEELELIMTSPYNYGLVENCDHNYDEDHEFNKESIFEINYAPFGTGGVWGGDESNVPQVNILGNFVGSRLTGGWYKLMPSASLVDEFTQEERPAGSDSRWDKRMYSNFFFQYSDYNDTRPDETWYGDLKITMDALWEDTAEKRIGNDPKYSDIDGKPGRFIIKKFTAFWSGNGDSMYNPDKHTNNIRVMRYAEALLLHAEACAKTGDIAGANSSLEQVRDRAGLAKKYFGSSDALMKEIEHQRILEFWMEGHRFYDLKRWYNPAEMKQILVERGKRGGSNFQEKYTYYPIPEKEINSNTEIEQHPLWR